MSSWTECWIPDCRGHCPTLVCKTFYSQIASLLSCHPNLRGPGGFMLQIDLRNLLLVMILDGFPLFLARHSCYRRDRHITARESVSTISRLSPCNLCYDQVRKKNRKKLSTKKVFASRPYIATCCRVRQNFLVFIWCSAEFMHLSHLTQSQHLYGCYVYN